MKYLDGTTDSVVIRFSKLREIVKDGSLACCSPWGHKELDMTEQQNNNNISVQQDEFSQRNYNGVTSNQRKK